MNDLEISIAALRWHNAHLKRLEIGTAKAGAQRVAKSCYLDGHTKFPSPSAFEIGQRLALAKRDELAARRELVKACTQARSQQKMAKDAHVIDVDLVELLPALGQENLA